MYNNANGPFGRGRRFIIRRGRRLRFSFHFCASMGPFHVGVFVNNLVVVVIIVERDKARRARRFPFQIISSLAPWAQQALLAGEMPVSSGC